MFFFCKFLFCFVFYVATVENFNVLTTLAMAGITLLCELHNTYAWLQNYNRASHPHQVQTSEGENLCVCFYPFKLSIHKVQALFCSRPKRLAGDAHPACVSIGRADKVLCFTTGYLDLLRLHLHHPRQIFPCLSSPQPSWQPHNRPHPRLCTLAGVS